MVDVFCMACYVLIIVEVVDMSDRRKIILVITGDKKVRRVIDDYVGSLYSAKLFAVEEVKKLSLVHDVTLAWRPYAVYLVYSGSSCIGRVTIMEL